MAKSENLYFIDSYSLLLSLLYKIGDELKWTCIFQCAIMKRSIKVILYISIGGIFQWKYIRDLEWQCVWLLLQYLL